MIVVNRYILANKTLKGSMSSTHRLVDEDLQAAEQKDNQQRQLLRHVHLQLDDRPDW